MEGPCQVDCYEQLSFHHSIWLGGWLSTFNCETMLRCYPHVSRNYRGGVSTLCSKVSVAVNVPVLEINNPNLLAHRGPKYTLEMNDWLVCGGAFHLVPERSSDQNLESSAQS